jgi:two-component system response regulator
LATDRHILVIEDNPGDMRLMREALKDMQPPVTVEFSSDCNGALKRLRERNPVAPQLIFLDFNLPGSDSREFLRKAKEDMELRLIPITVFTASDAERDICQAYELYANCYLRKPVDLEEFFSTIRTAAHFWLDVAYIPGRGGQ